MICDKCGALIDDDSKFCRECGCTIDNVSKVEDSKIEKVMPISTEDEQENLNEVKIEKKNIVENIEKKENRPDKKRGMKKSTIALLLYFASFFFFLAPVINVIIPFVGIVFGTKSYKERHNTLVFTLLILLYINLFCGFAITMGSCGDDKTSNGDNSKVVSQTETEIQDDSSEYVDDDMSKENDTDYLNDDTEEIPSERDWMDTSGIDFHVGYLGKASDAFTRFYRTYTCSYDEYYIQMEIEYDPIYDLNIVNFYFYNQDFELVNTGKGYIEDIYIINEGRYYDNPEDPLVDIKFGVCNLDDNSTICVVTTNEAEEYAWVYTDSYAEKEWKINWDSPTEDVKNAYYGGHFYYTKDFNEACRRTYESY